jgi:hypothetical protein
MNHPRSGSGSERNLFIDAAKRREASGTPPAHGRMLGLVSKEIVVIISRYL